MQRVASPTVARPAKRRAGQARDSLECRQIIETDRHYFELGARVDRLPGADLAWMPGLTHCPAAVVVQRVTPAVVAREGAAWVRLLEERLHGIGATSSRIYLDHPDPGVSKVLSAAGYEARREMALARGIEPGAGQELSLREVATPDDWRHKLHFHQTVPERPDGHDTSAADWTELERQKCALGMRTFLAWRGDAAVGVIGVLPAHGLWRLKNIVVHSSHRREAVGRGMISRIADMARTARVPRLCLFGVEDTIGEALYRACGFVETGFQIEWSREI
jgi:GNAT superfamily N-acetyltransferase